MRRHRWAAPGGRMRILLGTALAAGLLFAGCDAPGDTDAPNGTDSPWPESWRYSADVEPVLADSGMVVTTDALASEVGVAVLRAGGNAVDAAIAVQFALAVVNPEAGNIGGGGFLLLRTSDGDVRALDFRETAPAAATRDMFLDENGNVTDRSVVGHLASGVPGTVAGMWAAHEAYGTLPWAELLQPAVDLARGFTVRPRFLASLTPAIVEALSGFAASSEQFLPDGARPEVGDTLRQPDLAATLERIRDEGPDGFYRGETARRIVEEMERGGGILTADDLAGYTAAWREPITLRYRDHVIHSMPPSSSGGITMAEAANILEGWTLADAPFDSAERVHLLAEAWRRAYADRNHYLADPDFVEMPLETLASDDYAAFRRADVSVDAATPSTEIGPGVEAFQGAATPAATGGDREGDHTTHFSIVDAAGNAVSLTTTINSWYGSKVTVDGAGFVLNNEMDDFTAKPGVPNQFGLVQGENNSVAPGKRMLSAMTPSIVEGPDGELRMVTGTPGGATIITTVFQTISNVVDHGMNVSQAILAPRVHHQHLPDQIFYEQGGLSPEVVRELEALGHTVVQREGVSGDAQMIVVGEDGRLRAQADPRRGGAARGW